MPVSVNKQWCKKCLICIEMCPKNLLMEDEQGDVFLKDPEQCSDCATCCWICPDFAITIVE